MRGVGITLTLSRDRPLEGEEIKNCFKETFEVPGEILLLKKQALLAHKQHKWSPFYPEPTFNSETRSVNRLKTKLSSSFRTAIGICYACNRKYYKGLLSHINGAAHTSKKMTVWRRVFFI